MALSVEIEPLGDPIRRQLDDARAVAKQEDRLGYSMASRVVPGLCRLAVEAALTRAVRRRRLSRGDDHADVREVLRRTRGLVPLAALAMFDDPGAGSRVYPSLVNRFGDRATDAFRACNEGAHGGYSGSLLDLVYDATELAKGLAKP